VSGRDLALFATSKRPAVLIEIKVPMGLFLCCAPFLSGDVAMPTFVMLTRLNPEAVRSPRGLEELEREAMKRIREECPDVEWLNSYAVLGPCDYLDTFIASDIETAAKVSTLIRTFGHAQTEIWTATEWDRFKEIVRTLPGPT
jgi:uncharacterized protein with GYD domain